MMIAGNGPSSAASPWPFLLSAFAGSWAAWGVVAFAGAALPRAAITVLLMAGFFAVAACAVAAVLARRDAGQARAYWMSIRDAGRVPPGAWAAAALLMPGLTFLAVGADALIDHAPMAAGALPQAAGQPLGLVRAFGFSLLAGPLFEELGWRGVALAPLQRRHGALGGAALLGLIHALWHLPLFIAPAGYFHGLGLFTPAFWRFMVDIVAFDMLAAAIFNAGNASTLAAIVFHVSFNAAGVLWVLAPAAEAYRDALLVGAAVVVVAVTRGRLFLPAAGPCAARTGAAA